MVELRHLELTLVTGFEAVAGATRRFLTDSWKGFESWLQRTEILRFATLLSKSIKAWKKSRDGVPRCRGLAERRLHLSYRQLIPEFAFPISTSDATLRNAVIEFTNQNLGRFCAHLVAKHDREYGIIEQLLSGSWKASTFQLCPKVRPWEAVCLNHSQAPRPTGSSIATTSSRVYTWSSISLCLRIDEKDYSKQKAACPVSSETNAWEMYLNLVLLSSEIAFQLPAGLSTGHPNDETIWTGRKRQMLDGGTWTEDSNESKLCINLI